MKSQSREIGTNRSCAKSPVSISTELIGGDAQPATSGQMPRRDARARIVIADEGSGMDQKTLHRLFEPFFTTKKRGTGLGLSIVRQIIDMHGGTIDVQSTLGKGTSFTIELPLRSSA